MRKMLAISLALVMVALITASGCATGSANIEPHVSAEPQDGWMAKTAEQKLCGDTGGVWVNNRCLCPPGSTFTSEGCVAHSQYYPIDKIAKDYLLNSLTFKFDGIEDTLELVATNTCACPYCWQFVFEFECRHAGYGDRADQIPAEVITPHTAGITIDQGEVVSAIMDNQWDMMKQKMIEKDTGLPEPEPIETVN